MRTRISNRAVGLVLTVGVLAAVPTLAQVDPYAASTKTCESVINSDVKKEFPKAKSIEWDMSSVREEKVSKREVRLTGNGSYKGDSGKKRTFQFDCSYDTKDNRVSAAKWSSSFDNMEHVVVAGSGSQPMTTDEAAEVCLDPVERVVSEDFPSSVGRLEFLDDTLELTDRKGQQRLSGEGRFRGGGGSWRRFEFTCTYNEDEERVTDATWKHLGEEAGLD